MTFNIFQLDWITIDVVIIILLVLLLIGVKLFKEQYRWRNSFSNIILKNRKIKMVNTKVEFPNFSVKNYNVIESSYLQEEVLSKPNIIILRTHRNHMLLNTITEGLATYGCKVVSIWIKSKRTNGRNERFFDFKNEFQEKINEIHGIYNKSNSHKEEKLIIIDFTRNAVLAISFLKIIDTFKLISVNPRLCSNWEKKIQKGNSRIHNATQLIFIFSEYTDPLWKINKLKKDILSQEIVKELHTFKYRIVCKAKSSFKYYESLLLSILIEYIEN